MHRLKIYFLATRPQFFAAVILPVLLGTSTAWETSGSFNPGYLLLSLSAAILFHAGMNVVNDYYDYLNGTDNINEGALTPFTGGSRFIQAGLMTPYQTITLGVMLLAGGSIIGLVLAYLTTPWILLIGGIGLFTGFFYSAPPLFLAGRGLGEITVGINFGLLTVLGSYMVQTGSFALEPVFASLSLSFLISALLYVNEFPDYDADMAAGKRTLVVRLGPRKGRWGIVALVSGAYLSVVIGAAIGLLPKLSLVALLSLVFALPAVKGVMKNYGGGARLIPAIKSIILTHMASGLLLISANIL
jgi:1,4-dihydroxy-2-naphthoate octaprenyltransferase